jgi:hypothetical protein
MTLKEQADDYRRNLLRENLEKCTQDQQKFFLRMYPGGVDGVAEDDIDWALGQVDRTLESNAKKETEA